MVYNTIIENWLRELSSKPSPSYLLLIQNLLKNRESLLEKKTLTWVILQRKLQQIHSTQMAIKSNIKDTLLQYLVIPFKTNHYLSSLSECIWKKKNLQQQSAKRNILIIIINIQNKCTKIISLIIIYIAFKLT